MITTQGKDIIQRYIARQASQIANYVALGVGRTTETLADKELEYEVVRVTVDSLTADLTNNRLVFKANVLPGSIGVVNEVGLFYAEEEVTSGKSLGLFTGLPWTNSEYVSDNALVGTSSLKIDFAANNTTSAVLTNIDLSVNQSSTLQFAYFSSQNLSSIVFRMGSDENNYFQFTDSSPENGMNTFRSDISQAQVVGSPSWDSITYAAVRASGAATGPGSVYVNGIRELINNLSSGGLLVVRKVINPIVLDADIASTVEYGLEVTV